MPMAPGDVVGGRWREGDMKYRCTSLGEFGTVAWDAVRQPLMSNRRRRRVCPRKHAVLDRPTCAARCRRDTRHRLAARARLLRASRVSSRRWCFGVSVRRLSPRRNPSPSPVRFPAVTPSVPARRTTRSRSRAPADPLGVTTNGRRRRPSPSCWWSWRVVECTP